jgi:hypothetical protein
MLTEIEIIEQINKLYNDVDFSLVISFNSPSTMRKDMKGSGSLKLKVSGATGNINGTILKIEFKPYTGFVYSSFGGMISSSNRVMEIVENYNPLKAESRIYKNGNTSYLVEGHHTTVANTMLGKSSSFNMNIPTKDLPSATNIYWTKKWYEFWKKPIKVLE